jgi:hypothetical protein
MQGSELSQIVGRLVRLVYSTYGTVSAHVPGSTNSTRAGNVRNLARCRFGEDILNIVGKETTTAQAGE